MTDGTVSEAQRDRQRQFAKPLETYLRRRRASQVLLVLGGVIAFMGVYLFISPFRAPLLSSQQEDPPAPLADPASQQTSPRAPVEDADTEFSRLALGLSITGALSLGAGYLIRPRVRP